MVITGQWAPMLPIISKRTGQQVMEEEEEHIPEKEKGKLPTTRMDSCGICQRNGVSFRSYGEFVDNNKPSIPVLKNHFCNYLYRLGFVGT